MIVGRKPREEVGVQTPGEPWEHSPMSSGRLQRRHVSEAKPRDECGGGRGVKVPLRPAVPDLGSRTREQQLRFGNELPSVQGQVGAIWWRYPWGSWTPSILAMDRA